MKDLEKRLQALEDLEAIKRLKARYAQLCDQLIDDTYSGVAPKSEAEVARIAGAIADLFTEDAVWDGGPKIGIYKGRKEICENFKKSPPPLSFAVHYFMVPIITIDGNKARGRWSLLLPATLHDNTAVWAAAYEDDEYVKVNGQWLQSRMKGTNIFLTPYDQGWAKKRDLNVK